jgi:hypothetical protein
VRLTLSPLEAAGFLLHPKSPAVACRSYTRATSVLLPVAPHEEGIKLTPDIFQFGFRQETIREKIN